MLNRYDDVKSLLLIDSAPVLSVQLGTRTAQTSAWCNCRNTVQQSYLSQALVARYAVGRILVELNTSKNYRLGFSR